jgi:GH35 family endo-1,4-beta-xylanase
MKKIVLLFTLSLSFLNCSKDKVNESKADSNASINEKTENQNLTFACSDLNLKNLANAANASDFKVGIQYTYQQDTHTDGGNCSNHINTIVPEFDRTTVYFSMNDIMVRTPVPGSSPTTYTYSYNFAKSSANVNARIADAESKNLEIHGSCIFYPLTNSNGTAANGFIPSYLTTFPNATQQNKDDFKKIILDYVKAVTTHYAGRIKSYDVTNELFSNLNGTTTAGIDQNNWVRKRFPAGTAGDDEFWSFIGEIFTAAHEGDPNAILFYLDYKTEELTRKGQAIVNRINTFITNGIPISGYGLQFHIYNGFSKTSMGAALALASTTGLKIHMAELDVSMNPGDNPNITAVTDLLLKDQRTAYRNAVESYKDITKVPAAQQFGITMWDSSDRHVWFIKNGLRNNSQFEASTMYDMSYKRKPAYYGVAEGLSGILYNTCAQEYVDNFLGIKKF